TAISGGSLIVNGSLGATTMNVAGGAALGGHGTIAGTVTVAAQASVDLRDGSIGTLLLSDALTTDTVLNVGGSAGNPAALDYDVGAAADLIQISAGKLVINAGGATINISPLGGFGPGTYDLITFAPGQASGLANLTLSTAGLPGSFSYQLQSTPTAEQLVVTPEPSSVVALAGFIG